MKDKKDVLAQELKFAKLLASNDQKIRNNVLQSLKKWLSTRSQSSYQFSDNDFLRLWKGLYYCMWMSDKPLVQEELSEELGSLQHSLPNIKVAIQFFQAFLETMCIEWFGIDQWRIDKFMMLVRRVFRQMLFALRGEGWEDEPMKLYTNALNKTIFQVNKCPKGLIFHICDLYIEEIAKVSEGEITEDRTHLLIEPFLVYYTKLNDPIALKHVEKTIVNQLLFQSSLGQDYQEKFDIWKQANFPTKSIDDLEIKYQVRGNKRSNDDDLSDGQEEDSDEHHLDPRAGRVNVTLMEIAFDALKFAETVENLRYKQFATSKSRKGLARMADHFRKYANEIFPLGVKVMPQSYDHDEESAIDIDLKAIQLAEFEKKLAIGDVDSESSDIDEDLDNKKHGKLKRKNKDETTTKKVDEKKQKLSKLHNERFFKTKEDFTQDTVNAQPDEDEDEAKPAEIKIKKKKMKNPGAEARRKIKKQKRKNESETATTVEENGQESVEELPKKALKLNKTSSPSGKGSTHPFQETDEWAEPLKDGEVEIFVPSRKQKLKALQKEEEKEKKSQNLLLNPFAAKSSGLGKKSLKIKSSADDGSQIFATPPPRINLQTGSSSNSTTKSNGKRVIIALNKNIAQTENDYIKQVKDSPNLPTNNLLMKPGKSLLKPNALPSPLNPFYKKKLKMDF